MESKKKRTSRTSTLRKKFNNKRSSKNNKKVIRKKKFSHKGGMLGKVAAAGLLGAAAAQASGINIGEMADTAVQSAVSPIKKIGSQVTETAKDITSGLGKVFSSIRDNFRSNYEKTWEKIKGNNQYYLDGKSILSMCKQLNKGVIDDDFFKKNIDTFKNSLFNIVSFKNRDNRDLPFFFDILRYLGFKNSLRNSLEYLIEKTDFDANQILEIVDKNNSNCIHYCSNRGLLNPLRIILNDNDYLDDDMKKFSLISHNDKNLNPLHYALKGNHRDIPDVVLLLIDSDKDNSYTTEETNFNDRNEQYTTFLLKNKYNKKFDIIMKIMEHLIEYNFQLPIGKDFTDTNSQQLFSSIKNYIQDRELQYTLQLSHLNDHSVNFYHCPHENLPKNMNDEFDNEEYDMDDDDISDNSDVDEDGQSLKTLDKDITVYESIQDIQDIENNNLREKADTIKIPSGEKISLKKIDGDYQKIKYGPISGWVRRLELLKEI